MIRYLFILCTRLQTMRSDACLQIVDDVYPLWRSLDKLLLRRGDLWLRRCAISARQRRNIASITTS